MCAWEAIYDITEKYDIQIAPKAIIKSLMRNLEPTGFKKHVETLWMTGTQTKTNLTAFHDLLMEFAKQVRHVAMMRQLITVDDYVHEDIPRREKRNARRMRAAPPPRLFQMRES